MTETSTITIRPKHKAAHIRNICHSYFDRLWQEKHISRDEAYEWLATQMNLPKENCHFRYFNRERGIEALESIVMILNDLRRLDRDFGKYDVPYLELKVIPFKPIPCATSSI